MSRMCCYRFNTDADDLGETEETSDDAQNCPALWQLIDDYISR